MSFFENLFQKKPEIIPIATVEEEMAFLKNILAQSFSKVFLLQSLEPQEFELKEQTDEELIFQGQFGFFLAKLNEDSEIYHFVYTDLSGVDHPLVEGDHHKYGHIKTEDENSN